MISVVDATGKDGIRNCGFNLEMVDGEADVSVGGLRVQAAWGES